MGKTPTRQRLGLFGGTFNPIHLGHLHAARIVCRRFALDRILFIPSSLPPHKETREVASSEHRFNMVGLTLAADPCFVASPIEIKARGTSYSILTLSRIRGIYPQADIFFILGIDAFLEIETWKEYDKVLESCAFIVISRPGYRLEGVLTLLDGSLRDRLQEVNQAHDPADLHYHASAIFLTSINALDVSSTEIRRRLMDGKSVDGMVAEPVIKYIKEHGLYRKENE
jgi:nicotinate-nucleotide adenylyltransferase